MSEQESVGGARHEAQGVDVLCAEPGPGRGGRDAT